MGFLENMATGFAVAFSLSAFLYCLLGVTLGTIIGVLPGIGPIATIGLLLPVTFHLPGVEAIIVPIGGGSGAAGACIVAESIDAEVLVIGVQSEAAPAAYRSWRERRLVEDRMETFAEGLATRTAFELPQRILWESLDDFVLVGDDEIRAAQAQLIEATRNLVEAAGAAPLAAALRLRERLRGRRVALILSGGNASREQLLDVLGARAETADGFVASPS